MNNFFKNTQEVIVATASLPLDKTDPSISNVIHQGKSDRKCSYHEYMTEEEYLNDINSEQLEDDDDDNDNDENDRKEGNYDKSILLFPSLEDHRYLIGTPHKKSNKTKEEEPEKDLDKENNKNYDGNIKERDDNDFII